MDGSLRSEARSFNEPKKTKLKRTFLKKPIKTCTKLCANIRRNETTATYIVKIFESRKQPKFINCHTNVFIYELTDAFT